MSNIRSRLAHLNPAATPASEPLPGESMVKNDAGGFVFQVDDWTGLNRFLILGVEGGTYYASERKHVERNVAVVRRCLAADGVRVVDQIVEVSLSGRAPKQEPAIIALALALKTGDDATRSAAEAAVPKVCRIGTDLFHFAEAVQAFGGWGRRTRRAFARWYTEQDPTRLARGVSKFQSRDGWSHRDLLRLCKPSGHARGGDLDRVLFWATKGWPGIGDEPPVESDPTRILWAFERAKRTTDPAEVARLVREFALPRECVPSESLNHPEVWDALLHAGNGMPLGALVRNLAKMTSIGLVAPLSDATRKVVDLLGDAKNIKRSRIHPIAVLTASRVYARGEGVKGSLRWTPVPVVVDALDAAFYAAFGNVEPTGKKLLIAVDSSSSMRSPEVATGISPAMAATAMALVHASIEPESHVVTFATNLKPITLTPRMSLNEALSVASRGTGEGTDCSVPMRYATSHKIPVDAFLVLTDNETWQGGHPIVALRQYREALARPALAVASAFASTKCSIFPEHDGGCLNVAGFDASVPSVVADFMRG